MKNRLYFNGTVFKKDLTRFWPLWAIYLAVGLLISVGNLDKSYYLVAMVFSQAIGGILVIMCIYALIAAQLVFGELFNSRMCNAIHALPVRREGLFFSHFAAGMVMGLAPNFLLTLILLVPMGRLWYIALLCFLAVAMGYFFFFSLAAFCMQCAGSRFAGVAIYGLVNLISMVVLWYFELFYLPMLYGLELTDNLRQYFTWFSPAVHLAEINKWLPTYHTDGLCPVDHNISSNYRSADCLYIFEGLGNGWGYLTILTVLAVGIGAAALILYRRRQLESAGDFVSFQPIGILFTLLSSACAGALLYALSSESFIGLLVGLIIGFFVCRMLLQRTVKVFGKGNWLRLAALLTAIALSLGLTYFDVFGVTSRIPDPEDVESVTVADHYIYLDYFEAYSMEQSTDSGIVTLAVDPNWQAGSVGTMTIRNTEVIREVTQIHQQLIQEGDGRKGNGNYHSYATITIFYHLKNGSTLVRYYYPHTNSQVMDRFRQLTDNPSFLLGFADAAEMAQRMEYVSVQSNADTNYWELNISQKDWMEKLSYALFADAKDGTLGRNYNSDYAASVYIDFRYENGKYNSSYIYITKKSVNTLTLLEEYRQWCKGNPGEGSGNIKEPVLE